MPCLARQLRAHSSAHPSMAMMLLPEVAFFTSDGTSPPTPAMQDISAWDARSSWMASQLVIWAALEHPEQE